MICSNPLTASWRPNVGCSTHSPVRASISPGLTGPRLPTKVTSPGWSAEVALPTRYPVSRLQNRILVTSPCNETISVFSLVFDGQKKDGRAAALPCRHDTQSDVLPKLHGLFKGFPVHILDLSPKG